MLTGDLLRVKRSGERIEPRYLDAASKKRLRPAAETLLGVVRGAVGAERQEVEERLEEVTYRPADRLTVGGLRKLVLDRCVFETSAGTPPAELRREVFLRAARERRELGPTDAFDREGLLAELADALQITPGALEARLFSDLRSHEILTGFRDLDADTLLDRYDVALAQTVLLRATEVVVHLDGEEPGRIRQLFRALRFHGLLHRVHAAPDGGYFITVDGPFSLFSSVQRYGLKLAMFLPSVLRCRHWRLQAVLAWGKAKTPARFDLSPADRLVPYGRAVSGVAPELDRLLGQLAELDTPWQAAPSDRIFAVPGEVACVPDVVFTHRETGEEVYLEAFGFWSRDAVFQRLETLERVRAGPARGDFPARLILAVGQQLRVSNALLDEDESAQLYVYKTTMSPRALLARLDAV